MSKKTNNDLKIYQELSEKVSELRDEVEKLRPKEQFILWWRCYKTGQEWRYRKCFTAEEMEKQESYLTDDGRMSNYYEIFKTRIVEEEHD